MAEASTRLADFLGTLSLSTDLAAGVPMETSLRTCLVATRLARAAGFGPEVVKYAYYATLLRHLGCTAFAHEAASSAAGDDHDFLRTFETIDPLDRLAAIGKAVGTLAKGKGPLQRLAATTSALAQPALAVSLAGAQCEQASALAEDIGLPAPVVEGLRQIYERYDGRGAPAGLSGEALGPAARLLHVANVVEIQHRHGGAARAEAALRTRRGRQLDPVLVDAFLADAGGFWPLLTSSETWELFLAAEPAPPLAIEAPGLDALALAFARFADLKVPQKLGHSPAVAELVDRAALVSGLSHDVRHDLRLAALLHDLGVVGIPNGVWEKTASFNLVDWERVRRHAYDTERILLRLPGFARSAQIASAHHERADGTGYPRGISLPSADRAASLLACVDVWEALVSARPFRPAHTKEAAAKLLDDEVASGRLCPRAVSAVLAVTMDKQVVQMPSPATTDLTPREIDVLVEVARGSTNKEIAAALGISPRTAKHHLENVYGKIGVTTRAGAALYAARRGIVRLS